MLIAENGRRSRNIRAPKIRSGKLSGSFIFEDIDFIIYVIPGVSFQLSLFEDLREGPPVLIKDKITLMHSGQGHGPFHGFTGRFFINHFKIILIQWSTRRNRIVKERHLAFGIWYLAFIISPESKLFKGGGRYLLVSQDYKVVGGAVFDLADGPDVVEPGRVAAGIMVAVEAGIGDVERCGYKQDNEHEKNIPYESFLPAYRLDKCVKCEDYERQEEKGGSEQHPVGKIGAFVEYQVIKVKPADQAIRYQESGTKRGREAEYTALFLVSPGDNEAGERKKRENELDIKTIKIKEVQGSARRA
jgi:hypothetical protein